MGLVIDEQHEVLAGQLANALKITGLRKDDPDVRQGRLHENCRDITAGELTFQPVQVVELGDPRGGRDIDRRADIAGPAHALTTGSDHDQRLVHAAVVAVAVDQDLGPTRQRPRQPDGPAVGVSGSQREAPSLKPEPAGELGSHPFRVLGRQHRGDTTLGGNAHLNCRHGRLG